MTYTTHAPQPPAQATPAAAPAPEPTTITAPVKYRATRAFSVKWSKRKRSNVVLTSSEGEDVKVFGFFDELHALEKGQQVVAVLNLENKSWDFDPEGTAALSPNPRPNEIPNQHRGASTPTRSQGRKWSGTNGSQKGKQKAPLDISKPGVLDAILDLEAECMNGSKRRMPGVSEESCQRLASTTLIRLLDTATEDQIVRWAAEQAKADMGF